jgi:hypothetical protein
VWRVLSPGYSMEIPDLARYFAPLLLVIYPLGLLPESLVRFSEAPWLGWLLALGLAAGVLILRRAAQSPGLLWGVCAALLVRVFHASSPVDLVTLEGGGSLLLPLALINIAFAAFCFRAVQHPKWHRPVVFITTMLCVVLFFLQARENMNWREAVQHHHVGSPAFPRELGTAP